MLRRWAPAPGRPWSGRPGALLAVLVAGSAWACDAPALPGERALLELEHDGILLDSGITLHEVPLSTATPGHMQIDTIDARSGDVVRFVAVDAGTHAVAFDPRALTAEGRAFLEQTEQLRGPPLIRTGAAWVVNLEGAPPGVYRFSCLTHQDHGLVLVAGR